ncbi:hypothetical protein Q8723_35155, partial [Streptomyces cacaoi]
PSPHTWWAAPPTAPDVWTGTDSWPTTTLPVSMVGSTVALVVFGLAFTVLAGPMFGLTQRAAGELLARTPYVEAVMQR